MLAIRNAVLAFVAILGVSGYAFADGTTEYDVKVTNPSQQNVGYQVSFLSGGQWKHFQEVKWVGPGGTAGWNTRDTIDKGNNDRSWKVNVLAFRQDGSQQQYDWTTCTWGMRFWTQPLPSTPGGWSNWIDHIEMTIPLP